MNNNTMKPSDVWGANFTDMDVFEQARVAIRTNDNEYADRLAKEIEAKVGAYSAEVILKMESRGWELV